MFYTGRVGRRTHLVGCEGSVSQMDISITYINKILVLRIGRFHLEASHRKEPSINAAPDKVMDSLSLARASVKATNLGLNPLVDSMAPKDKAVVERAATELRPLIREGRIPEVEYNDRFAHTEPLT
jgi:hypothetical protein